MMYSIQLTEEVKRKLDILASEQREIFLAVQKRIETLALEQDLATPGLRLPDENGNYAVMADNTKIYYSIEDTIITIVDIG